MVADELMMGLRLSVASRLSMMQDQKLLTLCWRSFLRGGSHIVTSVSAHTGGRYIDYGLVSMHSALSVPDARPKIIDAPLTLIVGGGSDILDANLSQ